MSGPGPLPVIEATASEVPPASAAVAPALDLERVPPLSPAELTALRAIMRELSPLVPYLPMIRELIENPPDLGPMGRMAARSFGITIPGL